MTSALWDARTQHPSIEPAAAVARAPRDPGDRDATPAGPAAASGSAPATAQGEPSVEERALAGDATAWDALVRRHNHRVVVSLLARGVRLDRANDLAQDAWLRLIEQQREGRLARLVLPGLAVTQAAFLAMEEARRARRNAPQGCAGEMARLIDPAADAEGRLLAQERLERAAEVLATCSPSSRRVFQLVYGGAGLSHAEVAARVGLSLQRVRQIVCELRERLRAAVAVERVREP